MVRYGYNDEIITPNLASVIVAQIRRYLLESQQSASLHSELSSDPLPTSTDENQASAEDQIITSSSAERNVTGEQRYLGELAKLEDAYAHKVLYIIGKEQMKLKEGTNYAKKVLLWVFLWIRDNTRNKIANLKVPTDKVIEVGFLKEI